MASRRFVAAFGVVGAFLVSLASPAAQADEATDAAPLACRLHTHSAKDTFNNGYPAKSSVPVRSSGPYADCSIDGYIDSSTRLHYHCYTTNDVGNTWTWVRVVGGDIAGWVWDENLQGYGSSVRC
ncbi:hypothetical protein ACWEFJ_14795 [Actinosynnema sp. NPDC004786]